MGLVDCWALCPEVRQVFRAVLEQPTKARIKPLSKWKHGVTESSTSQSLRFGVKDLERGLLVKYISTTWEFRESRSTWRSHFLKSQVGNCYALVVMHYFSQQIVIRVPTPKLRSKYGSRGLSVQLDLQVWSLARVVIWSGMQLRGRNLKTILCVIYINKI